MARTGLSGSVALLLLVTTGAFGPLLGSAAAVPVVSDVGSWTRVSVDQVTVMLRSDRPFFIWWSADAPNIVYYLRFNSIFEHFGAFMVAEKLIAPAPGASLQMVAEELWREMRRNFTVSEPPRDMPEPPRWIIVPFPRIVLKGFPFALAQWTLSASTLADSAGRVAGVQFTYQLVGVPDTLSAFSYLAGNLILRGRIYTSPVRESFSGLAYDLAAGEVKVDVGVKKWVWQLAEFSRLMRSVAPPGVNFTFPENRLGLAVRFGSIDVAKSGLSEVSGPEADRIELEAAGEGPVLSYAYQTLAVMTSKAKFFRELATQGSAPGSEKQAANGFVFGPDQVPLDLLAFPPRPGFVVPLNASLGYFRFIDEALIVAAGGATQLVDVRASYRMLVGSAWIYLSYPYFGDQMLIHDPIMGTISSGATSSSPATQEPAAQVELQADPQNPGDYTYTFVYSPAPNTLLVGAVVGTVVVALAVYISRRKRLDVLDK